MELLNKEGEEVPNVVTIRPNGPVVITGNFTISDEEGKELEKRERLSVCRCGLSKNMPFCDGAHKVVAR